MLVIWFKHGLMPTSKVEPVPNWSTAGFSPDGELVVENTNLILFDEKDFDEAELSVQMIVSSLHLNDRYPIIRMMYGEVIPGQNIQQGSGHWLHSADTRRFAIRDDIDDHGNPVQLLRIISARGDLDAIYRMYKMIRKGKIWGSADFETETFLPDRRKPVDA